MSVVESTDDLTLVNDLYFFLFSEERRLMHVLIKGKRARVKECLLNDPGYVPTSGLYIDFFHWR